MAQALLRLRDVGICPPPPASPSLRPWGQWAPPGARGSFALFPGELTVREAGDTWPGQEG